MHAHLVSKGVIAVSWAHVLKKLDSFVVKHSCRPVGCVCAVWARRLAARRTGVERTGHAAPLVVDARGRRGALKSLVLASAQYVGDHSLTGVVAGRRAVTAFTRLKQQDGLHIQFGACLLRRKRGRWRCQTDVECCVHVPVLRIEKLLGHQDTALHPSLRTSAWLKAIDLYVPFAAAPVLKLVVLSRRPSPVQAEDHLDSSAAKVAERPVSLVRLKRVVVDGPLHVPIALRHRDAHRDALRVRGAQVRIVRVDAAAVVGAGRRAVAVTVICVREWQRVV